MNTVIVQPVLNFYRFYNVPLARRLLEEIKELEWQEQAEPKLIDPKISWDHPALEKSAASARLDPHTLASRQELVAWLQSCLDEVVQAEQPQGFGCKITETWMTRTQHDQQMHDHTHPFSVYSGVLYLQDSEGSTHFRIPTWLHEHWPQMVPGSLRHHTSYVNYTSPCRQGHLLIFPSHVKHGQTPYQAHDQRYSVAFNSFWAGEISADRSTRLWIDCREFPPSDLQR